MRAILRRQCRSVLGKEGGEGGGLHSLLLLQILVEQVDGQGWVGDLHQLGEVVGIAGQLAHALGLLAQEVLLEVVGQLGIPLGVGGVGGTGVHVSGSGGQLLLGVQSQSQGVQFVDLKSAALGAHGAGRLVAGVEVNDSSATGYLLDQGNAVLEGAVRESLVQLLEAGAVLLVGVEVGGQQEVVVRLGQVGVDVGLDLGLNMVNASKTGITNGVAYGEKANNKDHTLRIGEQKHIQ